MERERTSALDRTALVPTYLELCRRMARDKARSDRLAPGVTRDDLESAAGEALTEVLQHYPTLPEPEFLKQLKITVKGRMTDEIRRLTHRGKSRRAVALPTDADGKLLAVHDRRADDPGAVVAAAEGLPDPAEVRAKAVRLRVALLNAVSEADLAAVVQAQVSKAKAGHTRAAELLVKIYGGG